MHPRLLTRLTTHTPPHGVGHARAHPASSSVLGRSVPAALAEADVLLVMLGTNDAKSAAADVRAHFEPDLRALLDRLLAMRRRVSRPGACAWLG